MTFFVKLNLPAVYFYKIEFTFCIFVVLAGQQQKLQKYFDLLASNKNLNDSNP